MLIAVIVLIALFVFLGFGNLTSRQYRLQSGQRNEQLFCASYKQKGALRSPFHQVQMGLVYFGEVVEDYLLIELIESI